METLAGVDSNEEQHFEKTSNGKTVANPVLYQLVRVEGDGTLVPATDDEVMEVEELLEDDKSELPLVTGTGQLEGCILSNGISSDKANLENLEGVSLSEATEVDAEQLNAHLECMGVMLQKVKQEDKIHLSTAAPAQSSDYVKVDDLCPSQNDILLAGEEKLPIKVQSPETIPSLLPKLGDPCVKPIVEPIISEPLMSPTCSSSQPDFSKIKGEICLNNLSIKELHETFKATFGRETSVKDKLWLKRRIAMGLTNSCDVSSTTFIIRDNTLVKKIIQEETHHSMESSDDDCPLDGETSSISQIGDQNIESGKRLRTPKAEFECKVEELENEQTGAKRVRKPTKRYIEELSKADNRECGGRLLSSVRDACHGQSSPRSLVKPVCNIGSHGSALVTRQDSFGGSGVQVPYVSRMRRGRPRENFMSLMKYHPSGMSVAAKLVKKALGVRRQDNESGGKVMKAGHSPTDHQQLAVTDIEKEKRNIVAYAEEQNVIAFSGEMQPELGKLDSKENLDTEIPGVPTAKGGIRRKHHRAWSLCEVVKLVEGVSRYGIGRWSEIKRVSFASSPFRTSVDLKDKWRNLLRASFAQGPPDQMARNSRKHAAAPIPIPILLRVRELTEKHSQNDVIPGKFPCYSGRSVHEPRSGFL
ncbi:hypothetical protein GIB67_035575 [Kingdonia uniflora]|uniref:Uncharacterized protein n=1 Tax=Kingdonia uniflora TaxID=39325 RepID=A0A7J7LD87_9MAGN|nr:hypothetical protein GIB67_035575 [Kingdonia uniflora]